MTASRNAWNVEDNAVSAVAFIDARIAQFVARNEHAVDAEVKTYTTKTGNVKIKLVVSCDDTHGRVNVEVGSTFALDWERVDSKFAKNHDALVVKERETHRSKPARKPVAGSKRAIEAENAALRAQNAAIMAALAAAGIDVTAFAA